MFNVFGVRIAAAIGMLVAIGFVVLGIYRLGLSSGLASGDAKAERIASECLFTQRELAQRSAAAYSQELEAARVRAMAAAQADRDAYSRLSASNRTLTDRLRALSNAPVHVAAECFPIDLRMRIDAAAESIDGDSPAGQGSTGGATEHMPSQVREVSEGRRPAISGGVGGRGHDGLRDVLCTSG